MIRRLPPLLRSVSSPLAFAALASPARAQVPLLELVHLDHKSFGDAVAGLGDVDGDGFSDLAASSPGTSFLRLQVFSGRDGHKIFEQHGPMNFGWQLDRIDDLDGDGLGDLLIGGRDMLRAVRGRDGQVFWHQYSPGYGYAVAAAGDQDGDGLEDVVTGWGGDDTLGANAGAVWVLSGLDGSLLRTHYGQVADSEFGHGVDGGRDLDGDGLADLLVGAPWEDVGSDYRAGVVRVLSGADGSTLMQWTGDDQGDHLGWAVAWVGDADGDGVPDVLAGAPGANVWPDEDVGYARVFSGATGAALFTVRGSEDDDWLGGAVAGAGDLDGDGRGDVLVGASGAGTALAVSGADGRVLETLVGRPHFGASVDGAGDLDRDGLADIVVGAPVHLLGGAESGRVFAYLGSYGRLGWRYCAPAVPNSTGAPGNVFASGRAEVGANRLRLTAQHLPPQEQALLLTSEQTGYTTNPGGSDGNLCLGGSIARWASPLPTTKAGTRSWDLDLGAIPGHGAVLPGDTWNFQVWYRDGPGSNFTDAVGVLFE